MEMEQLRLRRWRGSDHGELHDILTKEHDISWWCGFPTPDSEAATRSYLAALCEREHWYCIEVANDIAGCISLTPTAAGEWELGYWLRRRYRHRGIMQESIERMKAKARDELRAGRLVCGWFEGNEASRRCQMRSGFKYQKTITTPTAQGLRREHCSVLEL